MNMVFLTSLYPKENEKEIRKKMRVDMNDAANELQWNLVKGVEEQLEGRLTLVNRLPIYSWPKHYTDAFVKGFSFSHKQGADDITPGFCNVKGLKQFFGKKPFIRETVRRCLQNDESVILAYTLHPVFLEAVKKVKKIKPSVKAYAIVADLPEFTYNPKNIVSKVFYKCSLMHLQKLLKNIDGFILLTAQMAEKMQLKVPFTVMEGIAPSRLSNVVYSKKNDQKIKLLYTGSMNSQYGICVLLDAFAKLKNPDLELHLCGLGNAEKVVKEFAEKDKRIIFYGKVSHEEVLKFQSEADILVNPRQNNEEFTKYSFPSKNLEYLSSGKPLVAYKLDGIPEEYNEFFLFPENNSPEALAAVLDKVSNMTDKEREVIGERARKFVLENKNYLVQTKKILKFILNNG